MNSIAHPKINLKTCSICLDKMILKKNTCTTLCKHTFHKSCIDTWAKQDCPVCRQNTGIQVRDVIPDWMQLHIIIMSTEFALESAHNDVTQVLDDLRLLSLTQIRANSSKLDKLVFRNKANTLRAKLTMANLRFANAEADVALARREYDELARREYQEVV